MKHTLSGYETRALDFDFEVPDECPMCHKKIAPKFIDGYQEENGHVSIFFYCTGCKQSFLARYSKTNQISSATYKLGLLKCEPITPCITEFSEQIAKLSERFTKVYNEAFQADQLGLNEIAGIGYRKALEILVKDYAIYRYPEKAEDIKNIWLKKCIETYINNVGIQNLAVASAEIGNDEAHYQRIYEDSNIEDMKEFISAAVALIDADLKTEKAVDFLNSRKKQ